MSSENHSNSRSIEIPVATDSFELVYHFIEDGLKKKHISSEIIDETLLVFEALFHNLVEQKYDENTLLNIKMQSSFGDISIKINFNGRPYQQTVGNQNVFSPENSILEAYDDKIDYRYQFGYNMIRIAVRKSYRNSLLFSLAGILLAILVYTILNALMSDNNLAAVGDEVVFPLIKLFSNAMLMVGTPVTFFSLIKNISDTYIISGKSSIGKRLHLKTIATSVITVLLGVGISFLITIIVNPLKGYYAGESSFAGTLPFSQMINNVIPSNIFDPFVTILPFSLIFVAVLITYALCSVGKYFDKTKKAMDACYTLFSKMLSIVFYALPFFCFLSFLGVLIVNGWSEILLFAEMLLLIAVSIISIALFYLIRLLIGGVEIRTFLKHLPKLILENKRINSAIDAVPFNIRYCTRYYGMDRKWLSDRLPLLAQINLDGNCYLITLCTMLFIFLLGMEISWVQIVVILVLIVFLSFGSPNQPGSLLIGMLIITMYLHADGMITVAIFSEVLFGHIQNLINVIGDIVTVAIEECKCK